MLFRSAHGQGYLPRNYILDLENVGLASPLSFFTVLNSDLLLWPQSAIPTVTGLFFFICVLQRWCMRAFLATWAPSFSGCTRALLATTPRCRRSKSSFGFTRFPTRFVSDSKSTSNTPGRIPTALIWIWWVRHRLADVWMPNSNGQVKFVKKC